MKKNQYPNHDVSEPSRRNYLKLAGIGTGLLATGVGSSVVSAATEDLPPSSGDWQLVFEDDFDGSSLDSSKWGIGFGWGTSANGDDAEVSRDNVRVANSDLMLDIIHDGGGSNDVTQGVVNTRTGTQSWHPEQGAAFGPGHYFEAKIKHPGRTGILPAFWSKPNSEAWPPEIDFVELFQTGRDVYNERHTAHYNIHYSTSGTVGDGSTHNAAGSFDYQSDNDLTSTYNVYGCAWKQNQIEFYFNGIHVHTETDPTVIDSTNAGAPFYMMLSNHVGRVGEPDYSSSWSETMHVDWVRVWEHSQSSDSTESRTSYLWARSADGTPVTFRFEASDGNIQLQDNYDADYRVSDDQTTAGGETDQTSQLPGFWYDGTITAFEHSGPLELYIDNEQIDPNSFDGFDEEKIIDPYDDLSYYYGDTDQWDLDTTYSAYGGSSAYSNASNAARIYAPASELVTPFERGDQATMTAWFDTGSGLQFGFGHQTDTDRYIVGINSGNGNVYLSRVSEASGWETLAFESGVIPTDQSRPIKIVVDWDSDNTDVGEIAVNFYGSDETLLGTISAVNDSYDAGGISLTKTGSGSLWVDYLRKDPTSTESTDDPVLEVLTTSPTNVTQSSATLNGDVDVLDGYDTVDCHFEWLQYDADEWTETNTISQSSTGSYDDELIDLIPGTEYAFRAVASTNTESVTGETLFFITTDKEVETEPTVVEIQLTDRSNTAWSRVEVDWTVSDPNNNLNYVTSELRRENDTQVIDSDISSVNGGSAEGSHNLRNRGGSNESYKVKCTVTDTDGNSTSKTGLIEL